MDLSALPVWLKIAASMYLVLCAIGVLNLLWSAGGYLHAIADYYRRRAQRG